MRRRPTRLFWAFCCWALGVPHPCSESSGRIPIWTWSKSRWNIAEPVLRKSKRGSAKASKKVCATFKACVGLLRFPEKALEWFRSNSNLTSANRTYKKSWEKSARASTVSPIFPRSPNNQSSSDNNRDHPRSASASLVPMTTPSKPASGSVNLQKPFAMKCYCKKKFPKRKWLEYHVIKSM